MFLRKKWFLSVLLALTLVLAAWAKEEDVARQEAAQTEAEAASETSGEEDTGENNEGCDMTHDCYNSSDDNKNWLVKIVKSIPKGYRLFKNAYGTNGVAFGDLNGDGKTDYAMIVDKKQKDAASNRGIVVVFSDNGNYKVALSNLDCFLPEEADSEGRVMKPLEIVISCGKLFVFFNRGAFNGIPPMKYTFVYQNSEFELTCFTEGIGMNDKITIYNMQNKKKLVKECIERENEYTCGKYKKTWSDLEIEAAVTLKSITFFEDFVF